MREILLLRQMFETKVSARRGGYLRMPHLNLPEQYWSDMKRVLEDNNNRSIDLFVPRLLYEINENIKTTNLLLMELTKKEVA